MKREVGLWIDHKRAVIFSLSDEGAEIKRISSELNQQIRLPSGSQKKSAEVQKNNRFTGHLNSYYDEVISYIRNAESILIFGPGEAKNELKKKLGIEKLQENIVGMETADKLTDNQIVAKVRRHFLK
jgi:stalled ribosome rescue protein Dom34